MLRIWQKTEKQKLEPVGMGTAFPFLKEKNHVVSIIGGGGKTTLLYEMAGFCENFVQAAQRLSGVPAGIRKSFHAGNGTI